MLKRLSSACAVCVVALVAAGCQSNKSLPPKAVTGLNEISSSVASATSELRQAHTALEGVTKANVNVPSGIAAYEAELAQLTAAVDKSRSARESSAGDPEAFFANWKREIDQMSNEELQESSRERYADVRAELSPVKAKIDTLRNAFRPHYKDLQEIATALKNDPTTSGVNAIQPNIERIVRQGREVIKLSDDLQSEIRRVTQ